jgi:DNA adenine methylase
MLRFISPLRYPGGKAKLAGFIKLILAQNRLLDAHYVEPYAGGASVALSLLLGEHVEHVHINDIDPGIFAFWHSVLYNTDVLCERIRKTPVTIAEWRRQRALHAKGRLAKRVDLGFSTLFLNRTNRSGIIASGGPIGGIKQNGEWKLDARFGREGLVERIEAVAAYRDRITLHNRDAAKLLVELQPKLPRRHFFYLDPPYYVKGQRRLYLNGYEHEDHVHVAKLVRRRSKWMVSYDDVPAIRAIYQPLKPIRYRLSYTAAERSAGAEVAFLSPELTVPAVRNPAYISN